MAVKDTLRSLKQLQRIDMSNTTQARRTAQIHTEPIDAPKLTTNTVLPFGEMTSSFINQNTSTSSPNAGKHRTLTKPHPRGRIHNQKNYRTFKNLFFFLSLFPLFYISQCCYPYYFHLHISLLWCCGVFLVTKINLRFLSHFSVYHPFYEFYFYFYIFIYFSYSFILAIAILYIYIYI